MDNIAIAVVSIILIFAAAFVIYANVIYWCTRWRMPLEQRNRSKKEEEWDMFQW